MYARKGRAIISQARVGGAQQRMTMGLPPPPEIKTYDTSVSATTATGNWTRYSPDATIAGIVIGTTSSNRIGRKIRVVGIVVRMEVTSSVAALYPWTMDLLWDKQPNGASPNLAAGSTNSPYSDVDRNSLPNSNFTQRYQFVKRVQSSPDQSVSTATIDYSIKCDKIVSYDGVAGTIADVETNNLLLLGSVTSPASVGLVVQGNIRILFVDA